MFRFTVATFLTVTTLAVVFAAPEAIPVVSMQREAVEGMVWDYASISLGSKNFSGRLEGLGARVAGIGYDLKGDWDVFEAHIGYAKNVSPNRRCRFSVVADQQSLYTSGEIKGGQEPEFIRVPVEGKKVLLLSIEPLSYGGTLGACFAEPMLKRGLTAEQKSAPYHIELNGSRVPYDQFNAPASVPINIPVTGGESTVQVKMVNDTQQRKLKITTSTVPTP